MKIVSTPDNPFNFAFTCRRCKSKLVANAEDVKVGYFGGGYCESGDRKYYVECPVCKTVRFVEYAQLPPLVADQADKRDPKRRR